MKTSTQNNLMNGSRYTALALTVVTSLATGLWASNSAAVVKTYHTDSGGENWVCGSAAPPMLRGILTENPTCSSDTLALNGLASAYAGIWRLEAPYAHDTLVTPISYTIWLDDSNLVSPLAVVADMYMFTQTPLNTFPLIARASIPVTQSIGANTINYSAAQSLVEAGTYLYPQFYTISSDSGSFIRLGTNSNSIRFTVDEQDALCTLPVTNLGLGIVQAETVGLGWTKSSTNSDEFNIYRNGTLIGTTTSESFYDNTNPGNTSFTYEVKNSNTALGCEGPGASITVPAATATPTAYDFGDLQVNTTASKTFTISNDTAATLTVESVPDGVTLSGTFANAYSITSDLCTGSVLAVGESCDIAVKFSPLYEGLKDATLTVDFAGLVSPNNIALTGGKRPYLVKDLGGTGYPYRFADIDGTLFFHTDDGINGGEPWKSDGTEPGTVMVKNINAAGGSAVNNFTSVNGTVFFTATDGVSGYELWKSSGAVGNAELVKDIVVGSGNSSPSELVNVNGTLFFVVDDGVYGAELWVSDGTAAGTVLFKDINAGSGSSNPAELTVVNGTVYFSADDGTGPELWKSDATYAGTVKVKDISSGSGGSLPGELTNVDGVLYFTAFDGPNGLTIWKSDGTEAGTKVLQKDSRYYFSQPSNLTNVNGVLFYTAGDVNGTDVELWKSYGSILDTRQVKDIVPGITGSNPQELTNVDGILFFTADTGNDGGRELWKSDGSTAGTIQVKDIDPGASSGIPNGDLTNLNGTLYFFASDALGEELWQSDGTPNGTFMLRDIYPGPGYDVHGELLVSGDSLYFQADDGTGTELWSYSPVENLPGNTPPTISPIADQESFSGNFDPIGPISFSVADQESAVSCSDVQVSAYQVMATVSVGSGQDCTIELVPTSFSEIGHVRLTLSDGEQTTTRTFRVVINEAVFVGDGDGEETTIQSGITAARAAGISIIVVDDGIYKGIGNINLDSSRLTIKSKNGWQSTTIDCNFSGRAFYINTGSTSKSAIQGFTIQNCQAPVEETSYSETGGAIFVWDGSPSIIDNRFIRNFAAKGGGAINAWGTPLIEGNVFYGNSAGSADGGAISGGFQVIRNNDFENNTADRGGAIALQGSGGGDDLIDNNRFRFNRAVSGGAISTQYASELKITRSSFTGNVAVVDGGAINSVSIYSGEGYPIAISNSIFVKNSALGNGGAVALIGGSITNSSFYANTAQNGGAITFDDKGSTYDASVVNSILWGNSAEQSGNQIFYNNDRTLEKFPLNLTIGFSVLEGGTANISLFSEANRAAELILTPLDNILETDPLFSMAGNLRLMPGSPAIDKGTNTPPGGLSVTDFDAVSRRLGGSNESRGTSDIGAFEFDPANQSKLAVGLTHIRAIATINDSPPESHELFLRNIGGGNSNWTISENIPWLWADMESGTVSDSLQSIRLFINHTGLTPELTHGVYQGVVDIVDTDSGQLYRRLTVELNVNQSLRVSVNGGDYETIQEAVDAAIDGDTVLVAGGTYSRDDQDGLKRDKNIDPRGKAITIKSENGPEATIIDADDDGTAGSGFVINRGEDRRTIIEGFTIREGDYGINAGQNVSATFVNLRLLNNSVRGMSARGPVSIRRCEFIGNNTSLSGGGLYLETASGAEVVDSLFSENTARNGGGLYVLNGSNILIDNSEFRNNQVINNARGGALYADNVERLSVLNSVFEGNSADATGGAIYANSSNHLNIANCLVYNNTSANVGGGIYSVGASVQITNSTISNNTSSNGGSGRNVYFGSNPPFNERFSLTNSILYQTGGTGADIGYTNIGTVSVSHSTIKSGWPGVGTGNNSLDPMFRDPDGADDIAGNADDRFADFRLDPASPMIDSGLTLSTLFSDIRGSVRPVDGNTIKPGAQFDRGAYEYSEYYGGIEGDEVAKSLKGLSVNGAEQVVGFEYVVAWSDNNPFPAGDPRISQAGEYDVNLALVSDAGLRIELDSFTVTSAEAGYNKYFTFSPEHIGDWKLRVELAADPNQFVESDKVSIRYKEVTEYALGTEISAPLAADRSQKPDVDNESIVYWSIETDRLYAVGPGTTVVTWYGDEEREDPIPVVAQLVYPESPQLHIADTQPVTLLPVGSPFDAVENLYTDNDSSIAGNKFKASIEGWAVLLFRDNDNPKPEEREKFEVVRSYAWNHNAPEEPDEPEFPIEKPAVIGKAITDASHDASCKNGYAFFEEGFYDGLGVNRAYDRDTREGPIFAVNLDLSGNITGPTSEQDDLLVVWYEKSQTSKVCWPANPVRYDAQWPTDPDEFSTIVMASALGSGPLNPDAYGLPSNMVIYNQPDPSLLGYNPNEEHAAFFTAQGSASPGVFPLRSDLNQSETSESYTLLKYREPLSNEWNMKVFKVVAGSESYEWTAGNFIAGNTSDNRYCLHKNGSVIPQLSCDARRTSEPLRETFYLDVDGHLLNPDSSALCYKYSNGVILESSCLPADELETYYLSSTGVLNEKSGPVPIGYAIDSHGVLVESDVYYRFHYNAIAGSEINPPYPLNQFAFGPCTESFINPDSVENVLRDKDDKKFAYEGDVDIKLNYFYKLQAGFYYPEKTVGSCVAWLEGLDGVVGDDMPIETTYAISWPDQVPTLFVGETLVDAKTQTGETVGLPNIGDQCQVDVLYDAPIVNAPLVDGIKDYSNYSVNLVDPLAEYSSDDYPLNDPENDLPGKLKPKKDLATGRWVFTALPYHIQSRLNYDEVDEQLKLKGSYSAAVGEPFLLMNVLSARDLAIIDTTLIDDAKRVAFNAQVKTANDKAASARTYPPAKYKSLKDAELKALTAGDSHGTGYVTLAFNNHADCAAPTVLSVINVGGPLYEGDIKVIEAPNPFEEKVTLKHNADFGGNTDGRAFQWVYTPADFSGVPCRQGGNVNDPTSCVTRNWLPYTPQPSTPADKFVPVSGEGEFYKKAADTVIQGTGQQLLPDKWFSVRYNFEGSGLSSSISTWTAPQLYEGWLKRVMKNINLYDQKVKDFHATSANTTADMISLAGQPYEGAIALSDDPEYLKSLGIIEVYETLLERTASLTTEDENESYTDINTAKLFASNRLADLYMLLGNEAYGDAADPTIGFSVDGAIYGSKASSIYSFQNQTDSLLEEELKLLRGTDSSGNRPYYNRLVWNFTLGSGEVAYKENYNISDNNGDGEINEQDAIIQFPQGHGDAWGHYLSASKKYYNLLKSPSFDWLPLSENILVAGVPVQVDYRDERRFASVAAAKAKSGAEIVNLTYRDRYTADPNGQWQGYKDVDTDRAWGVDGWSRRAGQGALFDWVTGNAILPATADLAESSYIVTVKNGQTKFTLPYYESDPSNPALTLSVTRDGTTLNYNPATVVYINSQPEVTVTSPLSNNDVLKFVWNVPATSIQKVDRSTVVELWDVVGSYQSIEAEVDKADSGLNPLGLVSDAVPFDIDPAAVAAGETHFEQIYGRAVQAMNNAIAVFNHANDSSQLMRRQQDTLANFQRNVENSEADYNNRLIEVFGYPYKDDCGPGKTYDTSYCNTGPDLYHYMYVDASKLMGLEQPKEHQFNVLMKTYRDVTAAGVPLVSEQQVSFNVATDSRFGIIKPAAWKSSRKAPGEIQLARSELLQLRGRFDKAIGEYDDLVYSIELQAQLISDQFALNADEIMILKNDISTQQSLNASIKAARRTQVTTRTLASLARYVGNAAAEAIPTSAGFSTDFGAPARGAILAVANGTAQVLEQQSDLSTITELGHQQAKEIAAAETSIKLSTDRGEFAIKQQLLQIENMVRNEATLRLELYTLAEGLRQSVSRYLGVLAKGDRLLSDRLRIRTQTAAQIQDYRYKDMTFRIFRNDALQKYRAQFDMAAMYVYLAAKAYDYETTLLDSNSLAGQNFLTSIIKQRTIGQIENGQPLTGSGLADPMKRLWQNFQVLKPQLGFNNPQQETNRFSLRQEMMRIRLDTGSNATWHQALQASRVDNLWDNQDYRRFMRPFGGEGVAEPGLIIPFSTTVTSGLNFFRWPVGGGDSYYSSSNFATKISSVGVWFSNYNAVGLAQTPRIYLVPVGEDRLRTPSYDVNDIRTWTVVDQKLPAPFPIVATEMKNDANWIPSVDTLFDEMFQIRRHSDFRAYHDSGYINQSELQYDSRLIGRSVWNSRWLLVIPGRSLLYNPDEGLDTFIEGPESIFGTGRTGNGISDIKLFFETYSYSGN